MLHVAKSAHVTMNGEHECEGEVSIGGSGHVTVHVVANQDIST